MADINFNTVTVASAINGSDYLHVTTGGSHRRVAVSTLIAEAKSQTLTATNAALLDALTDGCFVMYHIKTNNAPLLCRASSWTTQQSNGQVADGVCIVEGGRRLVIAPTWGSALPWSSSSVLVKSPQVSDRVDAMNDFSGKENTAAILANATIGGDGSGYAPGFCAAYSRSNSNGRGLTAGKWWLPSLGEMLMVYSCLERINLVLPLISGASTIPTSDTIFATSTEASLNNAWRIAFSRRSCYLGQSAKTSSFARILPVSDYIE